MLFIILTLRVSKTPIAFNIGHIQTVQPLMEMAPNGEKIAVGATVETVSNANEVSEDFQRIINMLDEIERA
jgi:hypothetical protein